MTGHICIIIDGLFRQKGNDLVHLVMIFYCHGSQWCTVKAWPCSSMHFYSVVHKHTLCWTEQLYILGRHECVYMLNSKLPHNDVGWLSWIHLCYADAHMIICTSSVMLCFGSNIVGCAVVAISSGEDYVFKDATIAIRRGDYCFLQTKHYVRIYVCHQEVDRIATTTESFRATQMGRSLR